MTKIKRLDWKGWLYSFGAGVIGGVATSVLTITGGQVIGAATFTPRQLGTIAVVSLVVNAAMFLKQSPLPKVIEVDE